MTTELDFNSETILDWFNKNLENLSTINEGSKIYINRDNIIIQDEPYMFQGLWRYYNNIKRGDALFIINKLFDNIERYYNSLYIKSCMIKNKQKIMNIPESIVNEVKNIIEKITKNIIELILQESKHNLYKTYCEIYKLITNETYNNIDYIYQYDYTWLEKYLTNEEKLYTNGGIPEDSTVDINMLPKYCCYVKATEKRGECFYISRHHPHLKDAGINDVKTTASKSICLNDKYHILLAKLKIIDENTGDALKFVLLEKG